MFRNYIFKKTCFGQILNVVWPVRYDFEMTYWIVKYLKLVY